MRGEGSVSAVGHLSLQTIPRYQAELSLAATPPEPKSFEDILMYGAPSKGLPAEVNRWRRKNINKLAKQYTRFKIASNLKIAHMRSVLSLVVIRESGEILDYGVADFLLVTDAGATFIADALNGTATASNLKYHGLGTGTNAPAVGDTALQTELTTQYNPDNTRATGTGSKPSAKVYRSVATNTVDAAAAVTEYGILSQAATGGGTLLDRFTFSVVNLASGDGLQGTFDFTVNSGG